MVIVGGHMGKREKVSVDAMLIEAREDARHADQKASVLLAALGIGFGAVVGGQLSADWDSATLSVAGQAVFWFGVGFAVLAVVSCALAVWPRYQVSDDRQYGITYWGHVAAFETLDALGNALDAEVDMERRSRHQLWRLSRLVLTKYRYVRAAITFAGGAGVALFVAIVVIR
jgi:hypothetical protein